MNYCKTCGSLVIGGSCTNRKCRHHIKGTEYAIYSQIEYIRSMLARLDDETEYDYKNMTLKEASKIIDELQERIELGGEANG